MSQLALILDRSEFQVSSDYFDATKMCQKQTDHLQAMHAADPTCRLPKSKLWADYARLNTTKEFLNHTSLDMGIPTNALVLSSRVPGEQGTLVHPYVAIDLASWLSPQFHLQVIKWVHQLFSTGSVSLHPGPTSVDTQKTVTPPKKYMPFRMGWSSEAEKEANLKELQFFSDSVAFALAHGCSFQGEYVRALMMCLEDTATLRVFRERHTDQRLLRCSYTDGVLGEP